MDTDYPDNKYMENKRSFPTSIVAVLGMASVIGVVIGATVVSGQVGEADSRPSASLTSQESGQISTPRNGAHPLGTEGLGQPYVLGREDAKKVLTIWEDMECPACASFEFDSYDILSDALQNGLIAVEYFIAPTPREGSVLSAVALACAANQNNFKDMHMALYVNQFPEEDKGFTPEIIVQIAELTGTNDMEEFRECLVSGQFEDYVASIVDRGVKEGIQSTPFILLDGEELPFAELGWDGFVRSIGLDPADYPYENGDE